MADTTQDFNINIRTLADLTGIKLTQEGLVALQNAAKQGNIEAINALKNVAAAQKEAQAAAAASSAGGGGFTGTAIGVGTIITLLTHAITAVKRFEDEQDKIIQKMEEAREKTYALGLSVADTLEEMKSAARIVTEPLEASFGRLTHDVAVLKSELQTAFETGAYEDAKKYIAQLRVVESQLDRVTAAIQRQAAAAAQAAQEQQEKAYGAASPQAKAILANEKAAQEARARGDANSADQFQKTADQFRKSASPADLASLQSVTDSYGKAPRPGRAAESGESQELVDQMERNRIAAEKQNDLLDQSQSETQQPLTNPPPKEDMAATPRDTYQGGDKTIGAKGADIIKAVVQLEKTFLRIWGP